MSGPVSLLLLTEAIGVASAAAVSYASTNFDNLVLLSAYGARPGYRPVFVKLTFVSVCLTVLLVSFALAQAADTLSADKIRYLGLIPIGLGSYQLLLLLIGRREDEDGGAEEIAGPIGVWSYAGFAAILLANSSDSVGVMTPLLADLRPIFVIVCFAAAIAMAVIMSMLANFLARHPATRGRLQTGAKWILPFLLIAIGVLILADKPADVFIEQD